MFPSPSLPAPALTSYQLSFGGLTFGGVGGMTSTSPYQLVSMTIDMADIAQADQPRTQEHGEFAGVDDLPNRDITVVQVVRSTPLMSVDQAAEQLGGVLLPAGASERPLWIQLPAGTFASMCRPRKHNCPLNNTRLIAGATQATTLFHSTDPRWYSAPSKTQTVGLPPPLGGMTFPLTFPLSFGGGSVGGVLAVYNLGHFEMRPQLVITGPCTNPVIANTSISGSPWIGVSVTLAAGDTLTIDTDFQSVLLTTAGSTQSQSRRNLVMAGSTWWNLMPTNGVTGIGGPNQIQFTTGDPTQVAGTLTVNSADAYLSL